MNADQLDLFASSMEPFKFGKRKIKLIECFGGIGSQARALEALHESGDSIVVSVLIGLFGQMTDADVEKVQRQWAEKCAEGQR